VHDRDGGLAQPVADNGDIVAAPQVIMLTLGACTWACRFTAGHRNGPTAAGVAVMPASAYRVALAWWA
jgi:hypothetical protein